MPAAMTPDEEAAIARYRHQVEEVLSALTATERRMHELWDDSKTHGADAAWRQSAGDEIRSWWRNMDRLPAGPPARLVAPHALVLRYAAACIQNATELAGYIEPVS
jgi:hypothetical protein